MYVVFVGTDMKDLVDLYKDALRSMDPDYFDNRPEYHVFSIEEYSQAALEAAIAPYHRVAPVLVGAVARIRNVPWRGWPKGRKTYYPQILDITPAGTLKRSMGRFSDPEGAIGILLPELQYKEMRTVYDHRKIQRKVLLDLTVDAFLKNDGGVKLTYVEPLLRKARLYWPHAFKL